MSELAGTASARRRGWFTWRRAAIAASLLIAFGIGVAAGGGGGAKATTPARTVTYTQTVTKRAATPPGCRAAITDARAVGLLAGREFGRVSALVPLIAQAAQAGANSDTTTIYAIVGKLNQFNTTTRRDTTRLRTLVSAFNAAAAACR